MKLTICSNIHAKKYDFFAASGLRSLRPLTASCLDLHEAAVLFLSMYVWIYLFFWQIVVFEEQKTDHNIGFTSSPDYGKTEHVK